MKNAQRKSGRGNKGEGTRGFSRSNHVPVGSAPGRTLDVKLNKRLLITSWLFLTQLASATTTNTTTLDPTRSSASFRIPVLWLMHADGEFKKLSGALSQTKSGHAQVHVSIDARSAHMEDADYEAQVKSAEFFDVEHYPTIRFQADDVALNVLRHGGELRGTLSVRAIAAPVIFRIDPVACGVQRAKELQPQWYEKKSTRICAFNVVGAISRRLFGMNSHKRVLGDRVSLTLQIAPLFLPSKMTAEVTQL
jgi:polyisoprenoid-binding protein YceI